MLTNLLSRRPTWYRRASSRRLGSAVISALVLLLLVTSSVLTSSNSLSLHAAGAASAAPRTPLIGVVDAPLASSGCGKAPSITPGTSAYGSLVSGGIERTYLAHLPSGYRPTRRYPLVLSFHGHGNTAPHEERISGFSTLADRLKFIAVYPQGIVGPDIQTGWASGGPNKPRVNDVLFVSDLLTTLQHAFCIDPVRIYATGFSNGGGLTSVLACRLSGRIAAVASVSGSYFTPDGGCLPDRPVPFLEMHGTGDGTVPYAGNPNTRLIGAAQWMQSWAVRDGCARETTATLPDGVTEFAWSHCDAGVEVVHYRIDGGVHVWPGHHLRTAQIALGDTSLNASALIWAFLAAQTLTGETSSTS